MPVIRLLQRVQVSVKKNVGDEKNNKMLQTL